MRHISCTLLDELHDGLCRVADVNELLAALDQQGLIHIWVPDEDTREVNLSTVANQSLVEVCDGLERLQVQSLLVDARSQHVVLFSGRCSRPQCIVALLQILEKLEGQITRFFSFFGPVVGTGSRLLKLWLRLSRILLIVLATLRV